MAEIAQTWQENIKFARKKYVQFFLIRSNLQIVKMNWYCIYIKPKQENLVCSKGNKKDFSAIDQFFIIREAARYRLMIAARYSLFDCVTHWN